MAAAHQNITLRLPVDLLRRIKRLAVEQGSSVSAILVEALRDVDERDRRYEAAKRQALYQLRHPLDLGLGERPAWTRDDLHRR